MEQYFTDMFYFQRVTDKSPELESKEKHLYTKISSSVSKEDYLLIEEELNYYYDELGKEIFYKGFMEGIRFLLKCLSL